MSNKSVSIKDIETVETEDGNAIFAATSFTSARCDCAELHLNVLLEDRNGKAFAFASMTETQVLSFIEFAAALLRAEKKREGLN